MSKRLCCISVLFKVAYLLKTKTHILWLLLKSINLSVKNRRDQEFNMLNTNSERKPMKNTEHNFNW